MPKPTIIVSLGFKKRGQVKQFRNLLRYLQYRDGSIRRDAFLGTEQVYPDGLSDYIKPAHRETRWIDKGMGETYHQITNQAYDWQGRRTLARTWVISPDPELMKHVPEDRRFEIVRDVTEKTVERWYSDNGWGQAQYSYVLHDKQRSKDGEQMVHSHVITPGTICVDEAGELGRIDHIVKRPHIRDLHRTAGETFEQELGRVLGKERAQEIIAERDARLERERYPDREKHERMRQLRAVGDVMQLLKAEQVARRKKKSRKKRNQRARQRQAELRMYARYINEDRRSRRDADQKRMEIARRQEQDQELAGESERHRQRVERIQERGRRIPTHAELLEQEEEKRRLLRLYYAGLFMERDELHRSPDGHDLGMRDLEIAL